MAYIYRHIRLDKNQPFYIGIGSDDNGKFKRAYSKGSRNIHWNRIVNKSDYKVDILIDGISWSEACSKEKEFISLYGRSSIIENGLLCNLTDGGDGALGYIPTEEWRKMHSERMTGRVMPDNVRAKIIGRKNSAETIKKMSEAQKGDKHWNYGKKMPEHVKNKLLQSISGKNNKRATIIINEQNGVFYETIGEAADTYGIIYSTLRSKLSGKGNNNTYLRYAK